MRYAKGHSEETRRQILTAASEEFRQKGLEGIGISELMSKLGLTHGGFYAHFKNKEALIVEMMKLASTSESAARLSRSAEAARSGDAVAEVIRSYVSKEHRDHPEVGCLMPPLAGDVARQGRSVRVAFERALTGMLTWLSGVRKRREVETFDDDLIPIIAAMVGAVSLARAVEDPELSDRILEVCRESLLNQWKEHGEKALTTKKRRAPRTAQE